MVVRLTKKLHVNEHPISVSLQWMQAIAVIMLTRGGRVATTVLKAVPLLEPARKLFLVSV